MRVEIERIERKRKSNINMNKKKEIKIIISKLFNNLKQIKTILKSKQ